MGSLLQDGPQGPVALNFRLFRIQGPQRAVEVQRPAIVQLATFPFSGDESRGHGFKWMVSVRAKGTNLSGL